MKNTTWVLGWVPATTAGGGMVSWVLTMKAMVEVRTSMIPLTQNDLNDDEMRLKVKHFDKKLIDELKDRTEPLTIDQGEAIKTYKQYKDDETTEEDTSLQEVDMIGHELYNKYISARESNFCWQTI